MGGEKIPKRVHERSGRGEIIPKRVHERAGGEEKITTSVHERSARDGKIVWPAHEHAGGGEKIVWLVHERSEADKKTEEGRRGWFEAVGKWENASAAGLRRRRNRKMRSRLVQGGGENGKPVRDRALAVGVQRCFPVGKGTAFTWPGRD